MKVDETLRILEEVAEKKSIKLTYEALGGELGAGGLCRVKGEWRILVDKRATPGERVAIIAEALARFPLDGVFIAPEVRELLEKVKHVPRRAGKSPGPRTATPAKPAKAKPAPKSAARSADSDVPTVPPV